jgi:putative flippase GtrA
MNAPLARGRRARVRELAAFGGVGAGASAVHFFVVAALVPAGLAPLAANAGGFAAAFVVSFAGHARWTFPARRRRVGVALARFAAVAACGFAANEVAYAMLLRFTALDFRLALLAVLGVVAAATWWMGKRWAFAADER